MAGRYKLTNPLEISRLIQKDPQIRDADDDENPVPDATEFDESAIIIRERPTLTPVKDKEVMQSVGLLRQYLRDTGINGNMNKCTAALLQQNVLPYNPYPLFVRQFSVASEKFHTRMKTLQQVRRCISQCPTFVAGSGILSGIRLTNMKIWGLQHVVSATNPKVLAAYRDAAVRVTTSQQKIMQKVGDNVSIMTTLQGPCIFSGSLYDRISKVNVCLRFLIRSNTFEAAARDFGNTVLCDIEHILQDTSEHVLSLQLPNIGGETTQKLQWSSQELFSLLSSESSQARTELVEVIGDSSLHKQRVVLKLLVNLDGKMNALKTKYILVEKSYDLMTLLGNVSETQVSGMKLTLYPTDYPYQALHESVFLEQSEAELYISTFKKFSNVGAPFSQDVSSAILTKWQSEVAGKQLESDLLCIIHALWLVDILQSQAKAAINKNEDSLCIQIFRLLQGNGFKIEYVSGLITMLYETIEAKVSEAQAHSEVFSDVLDSCLYSVQEYFNESRELTMLFAKSMVLQTLSKIQSLYQEKKLEQVQSLLNFLKGYLKSFSIAVVDEAVEEFPKIRSLLSQIDALYQTKFGSNLNVDVRPDAFRHSSEAAAYIDVDRKQINIAASAANFAAPAKISQQASRMQYCIDLRIDKVWKEFLSNLFVLRDSLPPNPYPTLISHLRQASLKVQLSRESTSGIIQKLLSSKPKIFDNDLQLYSVPGVQAYGLFSAVSTLNSVGFRQTSAIASTVAISPPATSSGAPPIAAGIFQVRCLMSISGNALLYGSASPYLTSMNVEEYCFIKGPKSEEADGILSLAKILLIYLGNMQTQGVLTIKAVFPEAEVELDDINAASARFQNLFAATSSSGVPVVLHLLVPIDWRYLSVDKVIHIRFIDESSDSVRFVTKPDNLTPLCQVFLNRRDAIDCTRGNRVFEMTPVALKQAIKKAYQDYNWTRVAHLSLCASVGGMLVGLSVDESEIAGFSWKLLHSSCGTLLYCAGLSSVLCEAVKYHLSGPSEGVINDILKAMIFGLRNCLYLVLASQSTICSKALNPYCQDLMQRVAPCDLAKGNVSIIDRDKASAVFHHICNIIQPLADSLATDAFNCVPSMQLLVHRS